MGMWNIPIGFLSASGEVTVTCTGDELIEDLYAWLGSPVVVQNYHIIADGCDLGAIYISLNFPAGSAFRITAVNGGRIIGLGGDGGNGGDELVPPTIIAGGPGDLGLPGFPAISTNTFDVSVDIDDGFLLGSGGGGGGGSFYGEPMIGYPGGGGGGGAGFSLTPGGDPGIPAGLPLADAGSTGGDYGAGAGGAGGHSTRGAGGDGGTWGQGGQPGGAGNAIMGPWGFDDTGGAGGTAGMAFQSVNNGALILTGSKSEATLRSEGRLAGETSFILNMISRQAYVSVVVGGVGTYDVVFQNDGQLITGPIQTSNTFSWMLTLGGSGVPVAAGNGDDYAIRASSDANNAGGMDNFSPGPTGPNAGWSATPGADGVWYPLTVDRTWTFAPPVGIGQSSTGQLFEFQKIGAPVDEILMSAWVGVSNTSVS